VLSRTGSWSFNVGGSGDALTITAAQLANAGLAAGDFCFMAVTTVGSASTDSGGTLAPVFPAGWTTLVGPEYQAYGVQYYTSTIVVKLLTSADIASGVTLTTTNGLTPNMWDVSFMGYSSSGGPGTVPIYIDKIVSAENYGITTNAAITPRAANEWLLGLAIVEPNGESYGVTVTGTKTLPVVTYTPDNVTCVMLDSNGTVARSLMSEVFTGPGENFWAALVAISDTPPPSGFFDFF